VNGIINSELFTMLMSSISMLSTMNEWYYQRYIFIISSTVNQQIDTISTMNEWYQQTSLCYLLSDINEFISCSLRRRSIRSDYLHHLWTSLSVLIHSLNELPSLGIVLKSPSVPRIRNESASVSVWVLMIINYHWYITITLPNEGFTRQSVRFEIVVAQCSTHVN
jgi:hypothetical protein